MPQTHTERFFNNFNHAIFKMPVFSTDISIMLTLVTAFKAWRHLFNYGIKRVKNINIYLFSRFLL